jgi:phenylacetate-CoA ligase
MNTDDITVLNRSDIVRNGFDPAKATGTLYLDPHGTSAFNLSGSDRTAALDQTREVLRNAGLTASDRVVVALNNDGELGGAFIAAAASEVGSAATSVGPRGRMRILKAIEATRASALICTQTGLADLLARLHLEFLVDPLDLELRLIIVTGDITDRSALSHLATEFGASIVTILCDPASSLPVGHQALSDTQLTAISEDTVDLVTPTEESLPAGLREIAVRYPWHSTLGRARIRSGYLISGTDLALPVHTHGDHILIRGRWLSLKSIARALKGIDGISHWELRVSRPGTLDTAVLHVEFGRESLVNNKMWHGRIAQALAAASPVSIDVEVSPVVNENRSAPTVKDERGHHLTSTVEEPGARR